MVFSPYIKTEYGADFKILKYVNKTKYGNSRDNLGQPVEETTTDEKAKSFKGGLFASFIISPLQSFDIVSGVRTDYSDYNGNQSVSPRFALNYRLGNDILLHSAFGVYHQQLPMAFLTIKPEYKNLNNLRAEK